MLTVLRKFINFTLLIPLHVSYSDTLPYCGKLHYSHANATTIMPESDVKMQNESVA